MQAMSSQEDFERIMHPALRRITFSCPKEEEHIITASRRTVLLFPEQYQVMTLKSCRRFPCFQRCKANQGERAVSTQVTFQGPCGINISHLRGHLHWGATSCTKAKPPHTDRLPPMALFMQHAREVTDHAFTTTSRAFASRPLVRLSCTYA